MVAVTKMEWHQVSREFTCDITLDLLEEIYSDLDTEELEQMLKDIESGEVDIETIVSDAIDNNVDIEWDHVYDDWWTDRKGGYEITYELGEE